jgi:hypothetical protein
VERKTEAGRWLWRRTALHFGRHVAQFDDVLGCAHGCGDAELQEDVPAARRACG